MDRRLKPVGELLRAWRERRRLSQLALSLDAGISTRHLGYVGTGRARPSWWACSTACRPADQGFGKRAPGSSP